MIVAAQSARIIAALDAVSTRDAGAGDYFFFFGTLAPFLRAWESPIAMACLRLLAFPFLPLLCFPFFCFLTAFFTSFFALEPYLAISCPLHWFDAVPRHPARVSPPSPVKTSPLM